MAQSSSGASGSGSRCRESNEPGDRSEERSSYSSTSASWSGSASRSISSSSIPHIIPPPISPSNASAGPIPLTGKHITVATALGPQSNCVEYERLVGKIMRDNFWDLDPFTVGLNPGLLNFDKPFIRSKAPHIKGKMRLLSRILRRMVDDEHLILASISPNMYRPHPNRSTIDYLFIGDDPHWIPHFFNGSLAYPHVQEAMDSITHFLDSKAPSRIPTVGISRSPSAAINKLKTEEMPSCEEYIDFVHAVVQSISRPGSTGTIREDNFFPSLATAPVVEVRKRAKLVTRLMARMVEDDVLTNISSQEGTYVLHPDCRPKDYAADRGLSHISHWVWTFKTWAVLDQVAKKAVQNLEDFLNDLSPADRSRIKIEREDSPPSKVEPAKRKANEDDEDDEDVVIVKKEEAASSSSEARVPKPKPQPEAPPNPSRRQTHNRTDRAVSSSSSGSKQSAIIPILTFPRSPPPREMSTPKQQLESDDSIIASIETPEEISTLPIQRREKQAFAEYIEGTPPENQQIATMSPREFDILHRSYPNDAFEVIIEKTLLGSHFFHIVCHDCDWRGIANSFKDSISRLQAHLKAESHVDNVMIKLDLLGEAPIETAETKQRMVFLKCVARDHGHQKSGRYTVGVSQAVAEDLPGSNTSRPSTSPGDMEMEVLQSMFELPQKAFKYNPLQPKTKTAIADRTSSSVHESTSTAQDRPSTASLSALPQQPPSLEFQKETSKRLAALEEGNRKKKVKLDHYGTLFGETNSKYSRLEKELSTLKALEAQHLTDMQSLRESMGASFSPIMEVLQRLSDVRPDMSDRLGALVDRDAIHDSRWQQLEKFRIEVTELVENLGQNQKGTKDKLGGLLHRESEDSSAEITNMKARIQGLESSNVQITEAQNELEQESRVMNARFVLLEQDDKSVHEAAQRISGITSRIETLEIARNQILAANGSFKQDLKKLSDRLEFIEQQDDTEPTTVMESLRSAIAPIKEAIEVIEQRFARHGKAIEPVMKKSKKWDDWIKYFSEVSNIQKTCIEDLQSRPASEVKSRRLFEERMEEMLNESKVREEKMEEMLAESKAREEKFGGMLDESKEREEKLAARVRNLEKQEERAARQLALLRTYASPRAAVGSDNERRGSSTPKGASHIGAAASSPPPRALNLTGNGSKTSTPIRPPQLGNTATPIRPPPKTAVRTSSQSGITATPTTRPSSQTNPLTTKPSSRTNTNATPIRPPPSSSQTSANTKKVPQPNSAPAKITQPLVPNRKRRKF